MKTSSLLWLAACSLCLTTSHAQVPVTVNRSTINSGGTVALPSLSASQTKALGVQAQMNLENVSIGGGGSSSAYWKTVSGGGSGSPGSVYGTASAAFTANGTPFVTIATNAPSVFTNGCSIASTYMGGGYTGWPGVSGSQDYVVTIAEDGTAGGGTQAPSATLTVQSDPLESISRKDTSTTARKLLGFQLTASTNAILTGFAVAISNTTTNGNPVDPISLYRAAADNPNFDSTSTLLVTTTNTGGFAIFTGLAEPITGTNYYFVAGSFSATNQTRNSFVSASLNSQNVTVTLATTNAIIVVNGGSFLGQQYAFLDTTQAEDDAAAAALAAQINASVTGATNAQASAFAAEISALGNTTTVLSSTSPKDKSDLMNTVLPAAAAGAAGIGAAFTSDALHQGTLSREFTPLR